MLTKRFGGVHAVEDLSFTAPAGKITGFLGPNGAGKTTTLKMLLGLVEPSSGEALVGGRHYRELPQPRRVLGAVLETTGVHPGRRAGDHLRILAGAAGLAPGRVGEVLEQVGLKDAVRRRIGGFSMGMRQRLGLAAALLGDPEVLVLDEPANGLDPEGMAWLRKLLRGLAAEGRTVLVSSHVLSEVAQTVDDVIIINKGRLRYSGPLAGLAAGPVVARTSRPQELAGLLAGRSFRVEISGDSALNIFGATAEEVGEAAAAAGIPLSGLAGAGASLERAFLKLTSSDVESTAATGPAAAGMGAYHE